MKKQIRKKNDMYAMRVSNNTGVLAFFAVRVCDNGNKKGHEQIE